MKFDDGRVLQMGGEIVGTVHHGYLELAAELGLTIVPSYTDEPGMYGYDMLEGAHLGEDWLTEADLASFARLDEELLKMDRWIRSHTRETFGPVRSVDAVQVFEIAFEGIQKSTRHKAGVALRFPRIARWRTDKKPEDADTLESLRALLNTPS